MVRIGGIMEYSEIINIILTIIIAGSAVWQNTIANRQKNIALFDIRLEHYKQFAKIIKEFIKLGKSSTYNLHNTIDEIDLELKICSDEAQFLFNDEIYKLENELHEQFNQYRLASGDSEEIKDEIFNEIVRTKYPECQQEMQKFLKRMV